MLTSEVLAEVEKLAGIRPKRSGRVSGTRAKLLSKKRPKKALKLRGKIQSRGDASKREISGRQKNPKRKMYKSNAARRSPLRKKLSFQRKGEGFDSLGDLTEQMRAILQT